MQTALLMLLLARAPLLQPPSWDGVEHMGCDVKQIKDYAGQRWFVHVWAEFPDHKWQPKEAYAIRENNQRLKALEDCDHWLKAVQKELKEKK